MSKFLGIAALSLGWFLFFVSFPLPVLVVTLLGVGAIFAFKE